MIITDPPTDNKKELEVYSDDYPTASASGSSSRALAPPPPFTDVEHGHGHEHTENDHLLVDFASRDAGRSHIIPDGPPPEFAPYVAESFEVGYGDIVSHDPHLNSDGEALYRFLLSQSASVSSLPTHRMSLKGTHSEFRERWVSHTDSQGRASRKRESYTETVVDFDFYIDICPEHLRDADGSSFARTSSSFSPLEEQEEREEAEASKILKERLRPIHWSVPGDVPAYRGRMVSEYQNAVEPSSDGISLPGKRKKATRKEKKAYARWVDRRTQLGLPPWVREEEEQAGVDGAMYDVDGEVYGEHGTGNGSKQTLRSSKTLRDWADEYCASPKYLKEFVYEKVSYGWNMQQLESSIRALIQDTPYNGSLTISFTPYSSKIYIRPDNRVSRMLSNKWLKVLSIILLIFPFVWLFKRFHSRGGGRWEVCGGAYPMKQWVGVRSSGREEERARAQLVLDTQEPAPGYTDALPPYNSNPNTIGNSNPWAGVATSTPAAASHLSVASVSSRRSARYMLTTSGPKKLVGLKEGEWFRSWEVVITRAVVGRYQSTVPLPSRGTASLPARSLDGYDEAVVAGGGLIRL